MDSVSNYSKEVAKGSLWSLAGSAVFHLISFFFVILIARAMSQDDLGLFFLALSVVSAGAILDNFGISNALSRYVPYFEGKNEKRKIKTLLKMSYLIVTVSALLLMLIFWLIADFVSDFYQNPPLAELIRLLSVFLLLSNLFNLNVAYLRGRAAMKSMQFSSNMQNGLKLALTAGFFYFFGASVFTLTAAFLLSFAFSIMVSLVLVVRKTSDLPHEEETFSARALFLEILPFGVMLSLFQSIGPILVSANRLLLGFLIAPGESTQIIAIYTMAAGLAIVIMAFPTSIGNIFLPLMSRLYGKKDLPEMRQVTETAQRWSLFITIPVGLIMILFSSDIMAIIYGEAYRSGGLVMSILTFGFLLGMVTYMLSLTLVAMRLVNIQFKTIIAAGVVNIAVSFLLIPVLGMVGAAIGSVVSYIVAALLRWRYANKYFGFTMPIEVYKLGIAGILTFILITAISPTISTITTQFLDSSNFILSKVLFLGHLVILAGFSTLVFITISMMLKCFRKEDIGIIKRAMHKAHLPSQLVLVMERLASYGISS
jgi:O-antigen/teichoic acid export membrane protein